MPMRARAAVAAGAAVLLLLAFTAGTLFAQGAPGARPDGGGSAPTHEQMHRMMDAMHGPGTADRMHEAMGPEADKMMDECAAMMGMMGGGMMGGQDGRSPMAEMMGRMMGGR